MKTARAFWRLFCFGGIVASGIVVACLSFLFGRGLERRAEWMQWMSRRFLGMMGCKVHVTGQIPHRGLVASNHLGYVDILVIGSVCPCVFVAKSDVSGWPIFGLLARLAGTVFVRRKAPADAARQVETLGSVLRRGHAMVLFPEGTSSGGETVLPFRSSLLQAAIANDLEIIPAAIHYRVDQPAMVERDIAFWADMKLPAHLWNLLGIESFEALLAFGDPLSPDSDRKEMCRRLHQAVENIHASIKPTKTIDCGNR
jgi:1-acyl-sn-glycerol-3-phosphate acyltransferase